MLFLAFIIIASLFGGAAFAIGGWVPALLVAFGMIVFMFTLFGMVETTNKNIIRAVNILLKAGK